MMNPNDLMDRFIDWAFRNHPVGRQKVQPLYVRYKQPMMYGVFGFQTFLLAITSYALFTEYWGWNIMIANAISWVLSTLFAFFTNRKWVFISHAVGVAAFFRQFASFCLGRLITLAIEEWMLWFFIGQLNLPNMPVKFCSQFIVIALNYVFSNLIVFRKGRSHLAVHGE